MRGIEQLVPHPPVDPDDLTGARPYFTARKARALSYAVEHLQGVHDDMVADRSWPADQRTRMGEAISYLRQLVAWKEAQG